jgi:Fe-S-cluster-containing dehydrogenase component
MPEADQPTSSSRRAFLQKAASAIFAGMVLDGRPVPAQASASSAETAAAPPVPMPRAPFRISPGASEDVLVRMQRDLTRALTKPPRERRWSMVIDTRKCVGCSACTIGCVLENKLPPGVIYRPVIDTEAGTYPNVTRRFLPRPCMQCDDPPCVPVCPVRATWKREDGIVAIDYNACIGCRYCITACPYQARTFDFGGNWADQAAAGADGDLALQAGRAYQAQPSFEYGREWTRAEGVSPVGNVRKCQFCVHRIEQGLLPMCVTTCIGRATFFGDSNDPESLVSELAGSPDVTRLKEEMGTEPKVYYVL